MSTKIRLNISQRRSYSALKLQQVGAIYIWGLHGDHHSVVKGKKKKGSTSQMSSIKATFSSLVFSFHVIFSLFSCPRVVLKRAESGMQGICLQRKTREKNIIFFFFWDISNIRWLELRGSRNVSMKYHFQRFFFHLMFIVIHDARWVWQLFLSVSSLRVAAAADWQKSLDYGCVFSQVTMLADIHTQTKKIQTEMIRHAVESLLSMPQHLGGVLSLDSLLEMSQRLIA